MNAMNLRLLAMLGALLILLAGCGAPASSLKGQGSIPEAEMKKVATEWITKQQKLNEAKDEADLEARIDELYVPKGTAAENVFKIARKSLGNRVDVKIDRLSVTSLSAEAFEFKAMYETTYTSPSNQTFTRAEEHIFVLQKVNGVFKYASNH